MISPLPPLTTTSSSSPSPSSIIPFESKNQVNSNNNNSGVVIQCSLMMFGPSDLCNLRQYLLNYKNLLTISCLTETLSLSGNDWMVFSQLKWKMREAILNLEDKVIALGTTLDLIRKLKLSFFQSIATSQHDFISSRWNLIIFIYTISKQIPSIFLLHAGVTLLASPSNLDFISDSFITTITLTIQTSNLVQIFLQNDTLPGNEQSLEHSLYLCSPQEFYLITNWFLLTSSYGEYEQLIAQKNKFNFNLQNLTSNSNYYHFNYTLTSKSEKKAKRNLKKINRKIPNKLNVHNK